MGKIIILERGLEMKLLNRLRELRHELHPEWMTEEIDNKANQHLETIGIGATTIDDIARLNINHLNLENLKIDSTHNQY